MTVVINMPLANPFSMHAVAFCSEPLLRQRLRVSIPHGNLLIFINNMEYFWSQIFLKIPFLWTESN